jgi:hypothetical protein
MMTRIGTTPRLIGAIAAAAVLWIGGPAPADAQTANPERARSSTAAQQGQGTQTTARKPTKPAPPRTTAYSATAPDGKGWTIDDALPSRRSLANDPPAIADRPLGRIPLQSGSIGFSGESQVKDNKFSDGRRVPGLETDKRNEPSYFGLSLSVPTNERLVPLFPRPE